MRLISGALYSYSNEWLDILCSLPLSVIHDEGLRDWMRSWESATGKTTPVPLLQTVLCTHQASLWPASLPAARWVCQSTPQVPFDRQIGQIPARNLGPTEDRDFWAKQDGEPSRTQSGVLTPPPPTPHLRHTGAWGYLASSATGNWATIGYCCCAITRQIPPSESHWAGEEQVIELKDRTSFQSAFFLTQI